MVRKMGFVGFISASSARAVRFATVNVGNRRGRVGTILLNSCPILSMSGVAGEPLRPRRSPVRGKESPAGCGAKNWGT